MTWLWTSIISPVFDAFGEVWQWLASGSAPAVTVVAALVAVVAIALVSRRRR